MMAARRMTWHILYVVSYIFTQNLHIHVTKHSICISEKPNDLLRYVSEYCTLRPLYVARLSNYTVYFLLSVFCCFSQLNVSQVHIKEVWQTGGWWSGFNSSMAVGQVTTLIGNQFGPLHCTDFTNPLHNVTSAVPGIWDCGSTGIFSKGHLSYSLFSYTTFRLYLFTNTVDSIGTLLVDVWLIDCRGTGSASICTEFVPF